MMHGTTNIKKLYMFWTVPLSISKPVWHIPLLCVQWKTPDGGQRNCLKHVDFHSKNKFEKLVHLVGIIIKKILFTVFLHDAVPLRAFTALSKLLPSSCLSVCPRRTIRVPPDRRSWNSILVTLRYTNRAFSYIHCTVQQIYVIKYNKVQIISVTLHVSTPECHLQGVYEQEVSQV